MSEKSPLDMWVKEVHKGITGLSFKAEKTLYSKKSKFQQVDIIKTCDVGNLLVNDGVFMLCDKDEFIYHEMIAHVPMFAHPAPEKVPHVRTRASARNRKSNALTILGFICSFDLRNGQK